MPLLRVLGRLGDGRLVAGHVVLHFPTASRRSGSPGSLIGMVVYVVYRRTQGLPLTETVPAPTAVFGPAVEVEYRSILLPLTAHRSPTR